MTRVPAPVLALLLAACGGATLPQEPGHLPPSASPEAPFGCTAGTPAPPAAGSTLAFLSTGAGILTYAVDASSGCLTQLDQDDAPPALGRLVVDLSGRFLYGSARLEPRVTGIQAYRIDAARGALEPIGAFPLENDYWEGPGTVVATADAVYTLTTTIGTGYHGGFWRFDIDRASGRLLWRDRAQRSRDASFITLWAPGSVIYLGTEQLDGPPHVLQALKIGPGGALNLAAQMEMGPAKAAADPQGEFLWLAHSLDREGLAFTQLDAYRPAPGGALSRTVRQPWGSWIPVAHPSGRVLYATTTTQVQSYAVDRETGEARLVAVASHPGPRLTTVNVDPGGRLVYLSSATEVRAYRTDEQGALRELGRVLDHGGALVLARVP